jgi:hypothetical protein
MYIQYAEDMEKWPFLYVSLNGAAVPSHNLVTLYRHDASIKLYQIVTGDLDDETAPAPPCFWVRTVNVLNFQKPYYFWAVTVIT